METADTLKLKFGCKTDAELGLLFNRGDKSVSAWRTKGLPPNIVLKARELLSDRGLISEPLTGYEAATIHRALTPDQEQILQALEGKPIAQQFIKDVMQLDEPDMLHAYSDFVRNWKGKK